jgi:hypothetical protein
MPSRRRPPSREPFSFGSRRRPVGVALAVALGATGGTGAMSASCLSVSPSSLPGGSATRPTILHDAVIPTASALLVDWPEDDTFIVPVDVGASREPFVYDVFVDYAPTDDGGASGIAILPRTESPTPESLDGGIFMVQFVLPPPDPRFCHTIEFLVAHAFDGASDHAADSVGGDAVTWYYTAGNANGCPQSDAGGSSSESLDAEGDEVPFTASSGSP